MGYPVTTFTGYQEGYAITHIVGTEEGTWSPPCQVPVGVPSHSSNRVLGGWYPVTPVTGYRWYPGTILTRYPHTRYHIFCSTWYRVLPFSSFQTPPEKYLQGCKALVQTLKKCGLFSMVTRSCTPSPWLKTPLRTQKLKSCPILCTV